MWFGRVTLSSGVGGRIRLNLVVPLGVPVVIGDPVVHILSLYGDERKEMMS